MKTILITGVGGYIGTHVAKALKARGAYVVGIDINEPAAGTCDRFIKANIFDPKTDVLAMCDTVPDACLHMAWRDGFNHMSETHVRDLPLHFDFVQKMFHGGVVQVAVMGSMHEVGYWEGPIDEATPCNPQSYYGIAKDALRRLLFLLASTIEASPESKKVTTQWLRGYYVYGDDVRSQSIFGKISRAAAAGDKTFPFTTGTNKYDFLHVKELADQIAACVMQRDVDGVINCCSGVPVSLAERIEGYISENGFDIKLEYGAFPDRPYDSPGVWGDATKIHAIMAASADADGASKTDAAVTGFPAEKNR